MSDEHELDEAVRLHVYRFFVDQGRPPVPAEIAEALGADQPEVERSLRRLHDAHVLVLAGGSPYIWMANPLSAIPTPFQVEARGRSWFGNCIWDGLGVVSMLGGTGTVRTWCPDCRDRLSVEVRDHALSSGDGVGHFAIPAAKWWEDVGAT